MFGLAAKLFIKDSKNYKDVKVREKYGMLSGIFGIILNVLLCAGKLFAGFLTGAVSVTADAFNNLTDAGSSVITFIGFRLSSKPAEKDHPFGHGRMEYIAGFIVSMLIFLVAFELIKESVGKLIHPSRIEFSVTVMVILAISVLVKFYMFTYNRSVAKKIDSAAMRATALDCINDSVATVVVAVSLVLNHFLHLNIDGVAGLLVALFILYSGYSSAKETIGLLLGQAPDPEYVSEIEQTVLSQPGITGVHDLIVHNYGPGRQIISLHAEVPADLDVNIAHDHIDNAEQVLGEKFGCLAVIHTDPIVQNDKRRDELEAMTRQIVKSVDPAFSIHDFRVTMGDTHTNLIFDISIPHDTKMKKEEIKKAVTEKIREKDAGYFAVCCVEYNYTGRN